MGKRIPRVNHPRAKVRRRLLVEQLAERRVLAAITGDVFEDANHSLQQEVGESSAPRRLVYIDANDNAELDNGESFVVADLDGSFEFPNLADGNYLLRLFNGTQTQTQTVPVEATAQGSTVSVADALQLEFGNGVSLVLTTDSLVVGDLQAGSSQSVPLGNQLSKMQTLPDGKLLIVSTGSSGDTSWIVDPTSETVTPVDLSGVGQSTPWSDVEIDADGRGVLLEQSASLSAVRSIDASDAVAGVQVTTTTTMVPSDTQVLTSDTGNRSVFGWDGSDGLQLSLWSNVTESFITTSPIDVSGSSGLLAFDDASGLLALRTASGGIGVYDVDADFAPLHTLDNVTGPVAIDGARDLLMTVSPLESMLRIINLRDGSLIADLAIDLSTVGQVTSIAQKNGADAVVVLGAAGVAEIALRKPAAHEVTISGDQDPDRVLFGVALDGTNTAPSYTALPTLVTNEDTTLTLPAPAALNGSADADGDQYVLVQRSQPENGTAIARIDGSLSYTPNADFNGTDSFQVLLHDGRDASSEVTLQVTVNSVPDVNVSINPVPAGILPGGVIGEIDTIDWGAIDPVITIDDPRFVVQNGKIIFIAGGAGIDFESEPIIPITITITNPSTGNAIQQVMAVTISDGDARITDITPHNAFVDENDPGSIIAELTVEDDVFGQTYTFTVDDGRFIVETEDGRFWLRLKPGVAVDYELEEEIAVNVTATRQADRDSFTATIFVEVTDLFEQPQHINLSNETVMELVPGDVVGEITLDGGAPSSEVSLTVDDPRFEIDGTTLKLRDDQFVERASQTEIELTISAEDLAGEFISISDTFVIDVLENVTPFHNYEDPYDVDHNGKISTLDALVIINYLNSFGPGPVGQGDPGFCYDVNADGFVTALDALLVLNEINRLTHVGIMVGEGEPKGEEEGEGEQAGEGEQVPIDDTSTPSQLAAGNDDAPNDDAASDDDSLPRHQPGDDVFERWTDTVQTPRDTSATADTSAEPIELPSHSSPEDFAENVDKTLRLLSDHVS